LDEIADAAGEKLGYQSLFFHFSPPAPPCGIVLQRYPG
jgi:hypothetical protein